MPFADEMIGVPTAQALTRAIGAAVPDARLSRLLEAPENFDALALRERADLLRDALLADIPGDYANFVEVVRAAHEKSPSFGGWMIWPVTAAVAAKAVQDGSVSAFDDAMNLMAEFTGLLSSEFAIRTLLRHDLDRAFITIHGWTESDDAAVRRLATEGTRPYLPWSVRVPELLHRSGVTVPILDALYRDSEEYVRRSVANHLNDLSRDNADLVVETASRWLAAPDMNTGWVVGHGLRTLIKRGNPGALSLLGFSATGASLEIDGPHLDRDTVAMGAAIEISAVIRNTGLEDARLAIDYIVHHQKANGKQTPKTFKLTTATLRPGQSIPLRRVHSFRPITTRRYYAGPHAITLQINGVATERAEFELTAV